MFERFTDGARRAVVQAQQESARLGDDHVGTEHLLLGVIHDDGHGAAAQTLESLGVTLDAARIEVERLGGHDRQTESPGHLPFSPNAKHVLEMSLREALQLGHNFIGTEHLLLGLIREPVGGAAVTLARLHAPAELVRTTLIATLAGVDPGQARLSGPIGTVLPPGPVPATCGFCGRPSPECGALLVGVSGALICQTCLLNGVRSSASQHAQIREQLLVSRPPMVIPVPSLEELAAAYEPAGPPPEDEEAARLEIEHAFRNSFERSADGLDLVNVEKGENLGPAADETERPWKDTIAAVTLLVDRVKFLDATHAVVWRTVLISGQPIAGMHRKEGRAVFVDGRWKMARKTKCEIFRLAGVTYPPAPDD